MNRKARKTQRHKAGSWFFAARFADQSLVVIPILGIVEAEKLGGAGVPTYALRNKIIYFTKAVREGISALSR